jgi:hypothetical protein
MHHTNKNKNERINGLIPNPKSGIVRSKRQ